MSIAAAPDDAAGYARRVAVGFAGVFAPLAVQLAFLPVWLEHVGLSPERIGLVLGVPIALRILVTPPLLAFADRVGDRARFYVLCATMAFVASLGYLAPPSFGLVLTVSAVLSVASALAIPLSDAIALSGVRRHGLDYGAMRLWGSVAFIAATVAAGWWLGRAGPDGVPPALCLAYLVTVLTGLALPRAAPARPRARGGRVRGDRVLVLGMAAAALVVGSQAAFYGFSSIHWASLGFSGTAIGLLWGTGVVAEVALFALAPRLLPRATPLGLLAAGALVGALRWGLFTVPGGVAWYALNSLMHAGSFGAAHLGVQRLIGARVDDARQGAAQGLAFAMSAPVMAAATFASGWLYGRVGVGAFWAMSAMCAGGLAFAVLASRQPQSAGEGGETSEPE